VILTREITLISEIRRSGCQSLSHIVLTLSKLYFKFCLKGLQMFASQVTAMNG